MNRICLSCQQPLGSEAPYHDRCSQALFGTKKVPLIPFGLADVTQQALQTGPRMSLSGVQAKLSVRIRPGSGTVETVSEGGTHILKPPPESFPELPQNENLCMNMASLLDLSVPPHGLLPMADGTLCYMVKRFDRRKDGISLSKESFFQILEAEDKYQGSLEKVGKSIVRHVANPGLDRMEFFERVLFCFLTGNGDMHLKNWALLTDENDRVSLSPCYDFVSSKIYLSEEDDSALTVNGKKNKLGREDFLILAESLNVPAKASGASFQKMAAAKDRLGKLLNSSFLSEPLCRKMDQVFTDRFHRLGVGPAV